MYFLVIFRSWLDSLTIFKPRAFLSLLRTSLSHFSYALKQTIMLFWWVLLFDVIINLLFHRYFLEIFQDTTKLIDSVGPLAFFIFVASASWLLITTAFTLFVRSRSDQLSPMDYFRMYFLRFIHLRLFFYLIHVVFLLFLAGLSIELMVQPASWLLFIVQFLSVLIMFFWLDSRFTGKDIIIAIERGANLLVYNMPFFALIMGLAMGVSWLLKIIMMQWVDMSTQKSILEVALLFLKALPTWASMMVMLIAKYVGTLAEFFMISVIYIHYKQKKDKIYADSIFE